jgi:serine protease Do
MSLEDITPILQRKLHIEDRRGIVVTDVAEGSAAQEAGIEAGDIVEEVNRTPVQSVAEYLAALGKAKKGAPVLLLLKRGAATFYTSLKTS